MVERLRAKPGSDRVATTIGDFATVRVEGAFRLVYLLFNTIMNLTTQDDQVACFANAAAHLEPGGYFVVEVGVPDLRRLPPGERFRPFEVTPNHLGFDEYTDLVEQLMFSHHYRVGDGAPGVSSAPFRYVWPSELDLMARLAGLTRRERWAGWSRQPFTGESSSHVSVWQRPPASHPARIPASCSSAAMTPDHSSTGSSSISSSESHAVGTVARPTQLDISCVLPEPAGTITTVRGRPSRTADARRDAGAPRSAPGARGSQLRSHQRRVGAAGPFRLGCPSRSCHGFLRRAPGFEPSLMGISAGDRRLGDFGQVAALLSMRRMISLPISASTK